MGSFYHSLIVLGGSVCRLSHHLDGGAVPADMLKSRKRFMHQYALVVKKIQALQAVRTKALSTQHHLPSCCLRGCFRLLYLCILTPLRCPRQIKTKSKVNASFTPARLKEAKKTEKQIRFECRPTKRRVSE